MWHGAGARPDAIRALKQVKKGDRVLCYHSAGPGTSITIVSPRPVTLVEMRGNSALRKVKLLKNVRLIVSPLSEPEYQELLKMAGIVAMPGVPLP